MGTIGEVADIVRAPLLRRIAELEAKVRQLEARAPTEWAYTQACKALAHWRKEAARLGKKCRETPREMKPSKP